MSRQEAQLKAYVGEPTPADRYALVVENLWFAYQEGCPVLSGVTFSVQIGETVGIIGPNGAGKSTLLLILDGLVDLNKVKGKVQILGYDLAQSNMKAIRRQVGFLFQDADDQLFCPTVYDDVAFALRQLDLPEAIIRQKVTKVLAELGLSGFENRITQHLSLGEKKRVCLAGILVYEPALLLFDEPTANLDPRARREFINLCHRLPATKLIASHDLEMILALCDRVVLLDEGRIVSQGPTHTLLSDEKLMLEHGLEKPHSLYHRHPHGQEPS